MTPEWERVPPVQAEWCRQRGIDLKTPASWRRSPSWEPAVAAHNHMLATDPSNVDKVVARLRKEALSGDVNAMRAYMQYAADRESSEGETVQNMTDTQLVTALEQAIKEVTARASA